MFEVCYSNNTMMEQKLNFSYKTFDIQYFRRLTFRTSDTKIVNILISLYQPWAENFQIYITKHN